MTSLSDAAGEYLRAGLHILALEGKKPNPRVHGESWSWADSFWGAAESASDVAQIERAFDFSRSGTTGIAILIPPDFLVADVDTDRAAQLLVDLGYTGTDETVAATTKNGIHIWFWWPGAERNRWLGDGQQPDPSRTLLFKGFGGYVVAPPSKHFDSAGREDGDYAWISPLVVNGMLQMPDTLPAGAGTKMRVADQWAAMKPDKEQMSHFTMTPVEGLQWWQWPVDRTYAMEGLERAIENAADGNQNNVIHWAALTCKEEGVPYDVAMERLLAAAERGNHPRNRARDTIRGAYKRG